MNMRVFMFFLLLLIPFFPFPFEISKYVDFPE